MLVQLLRGIIEGSTPLGQDRQGCREVALDIVYRHNEYITNDIQQECLLGSWRREVGNEFSSEKCTVYWPFFLLTFFWGRVAKGGWN